MKILYKINSGLLFTCTIIALVITFTSSPGFAIPIAVSGGPYTIEVGEDLRLDGSASYVTDALKGNLITKYDWVFATGGSPFAEGATIVMTYQQLMDAIEARGQTAGIVDSYYVYTIDLLVEDTTHRTDYDRTPIMINFQSTPAPVPEPSTMFLIGTGLLCIAGARRTKRFFSSRN